jgi:hypothetical protein
MLNRVQYPEHIEPLVQFIEETPRDQILDRTLEKLRAGMPIETLLTASALAVTRSSDLPPGHHGGPLHPVAGLYPIWQLVQRLEGDDKFLPVLQHVALANKHVHDPVTSPFALLEFEALDAEGGSQSKAEYLAGDGQGEMARGAGIEGAKEAFYKAVSRGETNKADHLFLWMWDNMPASEVFDLLMSVAIPKNGIDDHYFMYPATCWRALDTFVDKQYLKVLMRPVVRYVTRFPTTRSYPEIDRLIEQHGLLGRILRQRTGDDETAAIGVLGEAIRDCDDFNEIPKMMAQALADGLSIEGAGEALSIGAAGLFMRSLTGNPMDVHMHTSVNIRRWLLKLDGLSIHSKLLILMTWHMGPEIKSTQFRMEPAGAQPDMDAVAKLPHRSQEDLLAAISKSIYTQPATDWSQVSNLGRMRAVPEVKGTINLATQYTQLGYDPKAFMDMLGQIVCHDNFTEMHAFKHHNAVVEEFYATREPYRWMHLVCGAQAAAVSFGKNMEIFEEALELMHAA